MAWHWKPAIDVCMEPCFKSHNLIPVQFQLQHQTWSNDQSQHDLLYGVASSQHNSEMANYELKRNDHGQLRDKSLIPKVHVFFYMPIFLES